MENPVARPGNRPPRWFSEPDMEGESSPSKPGGHRCPGLPRAVRRRRAALFIAAAGPESNDTDFTWAEFRRRNNDELVAGWGNLVNRSISMAAKNFGAIPSADQLTAADEALLEVAREGFTTVGDLIGRHRQKAAIGEAMRVVAEANKYLSEQAPWKLKSDDEKPRMGTVLHVALQVVSDANTPRALSPFLPHSAQRVHELLGNTGVHQRCRPSWRSTTWTAGPRTRCSPATTPAGPSGPRCAGAVRRWPRRSRCPQARPVGGRGGNWPARGLGEPVGQVKQPVGGCATRPG